MVRNQADQINKNSERVNASLAVNVVMQKEMGEQNQEIYMVKQELREFKNKTDAFIVALNKGKHKAQRLYKQVLCMNIEQAPVDLYVKFGTQNSDFRLKSAFLSIYANLDPKSNFLRKIKYCVT